MLFSMFAGTMLSLRPLLGLVVTGFWMVHTFHSRAWTGQRPAGVSFPLHHPQCVYFACGSARDLCLILWYAVRILQQKIFQPVFSSAQRYARVLREVLCKVMAWELTKHNTATRLKAPSSSTEARPLGFQENRGYLM